VASKEVMGLLFRTFLHSAHQAVTGAIDQYVYLAEMTSRLFNRNSSCSTVIYTQLQ